MKGTEKIMTNIDSFKKRGYQKYLEIYFPIEILNLKENYNVRKITICNHMASQGRRNFNSRAKLGCIFYK